MYKLIIAILLCVGCAMLSAWQLDEHMAMQALFQAKHALNRAAHAAAQQVDEERLADGVRWIDEAEAASVAHMYLRENLSLDASLRPLPDTYWRTQAKVLVFEVINGDELFPYVYENAEYGMKETLHRPGVVMVLSMEYPRAYRLISPITWEVKGSAELVLP